MLLVTYSSGFASHLAKVLRLREILLSSTPLSCPCWNFSNRWTLTHLEDPAQQAPSKKHSPRGPVKVADFSPCLPEHFLGILIIITYFICLFVHMSVFSHQIETTLNQKLHLICFYFPQRPVCNVEWMNEWTGTSIPSCEPRQNLAVFAKLFMGRQNR